ncbi:hypothetical protein [Chitinophaga vietnamensis]|uniref:hypothetical protein n=1 Tax=Chitinophaga vietnamensis TaxID=2593957 RepID=UPI0011780490|nr:hypothetical protein [Chitinophaga vietnamensis]
MKSNYFLYWLLGSSLLFTCCTKEHQLTSVEDDRKVDFASIDSLGVYLSFSDLNAFQQALIQQHRKFSEGATDIDPFKPGFKSMFTAYQAFNHRLDEMEKRQDSTGFCKLKADYATVLHWNDSTSFKLNCNDPVIASLVNTNGIVKIGNEIHQYSRNKTVVLKSGDRSVLQQAAMMEGNTENRMYKVMMNNQGTSAKLTFPNFPKEYTLDCGNPGNNETKSNSTYGNQLSITSGKYTLYAWLNIASIRRNGVLYGLASIGYRAEEKGFLGVKREVKVVAPTAAGSVIVTYPSPGVPVANYRRGYSFYDFSFTDTMYDKYYTTWNGTFILAISEKLAKYPTPGDIVTLGGSLPALIMRYGASPECAPYLFNDITPYGLDMQTMGNNYYWQQLSILEAQVPARPFVFKVQIEGVAGQFTFQWI